MPLFHFRHHSLHFPLIVLHLFSQGGVALSRRSERISLLLKQSVLLFFLFLLLKPELFVLGFACLAEGLALGDHALLLLRRGEPHVVDPLLMLLLLCLDLLLVFLLLLFQLILHVGECR